MMNVEMIKRVCKGQVVKACKDRVVGKDRTKLSLLKGSFLDPGPDFSFNFIPIFMSSGVLSRSLTKNVHS